MQATFPLIVPFLTAIFGVLVIRSSARRRMIFTASAGAQLAYAVWMLTNVSANGPTVMFLGGWSAPFGIAIVVDHIAAIMVVLTALTALACILFGFLEVSVRNEHPLRLPLVQFLVLGINLSVMTGDLFNLFVAFEVMLLSSYALLTLEADDWDVRQAFPYLAINLFASALLVAVCGFAYGLFGTLNFAQIAQRAQEMGGDPLLVAFGMFAMIVFGIKAGLFPLYYWLPNAYPIMPIALAALFGGMLTKVGIYVLLRLFGTLLPHDMDYLYTTLAWLSAGTMFFGVLGAASRTYIRGILSFHILSQVGFMMLAISLMTPYAFAAAILYMGHNIIVKSSLFLVGGATMVLNRTDRLDRTGNLWERTPVLGVTFLLLALSLSGIPPLSGFWGKYMIVVAGFTAGEYVLVAIAIITGLLTLFSMLKIWLGAFWQKNEATPVRTDDRAWVPMTGIIAVMTVISLVIGLFPEYFIQLCMTAAHELLDKESYIQLVLGTAP
ncbi:MAG: hypothetical protein JJU00_12945 [Opitutales bacterium]|nr:hypothetical protein [Opitutales bacterium]